MRFGCALTTEKMEENAQLKSYFSLRPSSRNSVPNFTYPYELLALSSGHGDVFDNKTVVERILAGRENVCG